MNNTSKNAFVRFEQHQKTSINFSLLCNNLSSCDHLTFNLIVSWKTINANVRCELKSTISHGLSVFK